MHTTPRLKSNSERYIFISVGYYAALLTAIITAITFIIAILTPPLSGPLCTSRCYTYPYFDVASRFPRDYYWMYPAMLVTILFLILMACVHQYAVLAKKIYSLISLLFASLATITLFIDYFVQVTVIQPSLLNQETEGISMLTQYNPHGVFIALEEAGYLMMSLALFFMYPVFPKYNKTGKRFAPFILHPWP